MKIKGKELMLNKKKTTTKKRKQILKARALFLCLKTYFKTLIYIFIKKNLEENVEPNDRFSSLLKFFFLKTDCVKQDGKFILYRLCWSCIILRRVVQEDECHDYWILSTFSFRRISFVCQWWPYIGTKSQWGM